MYQVQIYEGRSGDWYWRFVASNGQIVATGHEGYVSKRGAEAAFLRVRDAMSGHRIEAQSSHERGLEVDTADDL